MPSPFYIVVLATAVSGLWMLWDFGIKSFFLDRLREQLFEIRFRLFRLGMDGELEFNDPAYRHIEILLCGLARYAHRVSFLTFIFSAREQEKEKQDKDYVDLYRLIDLRVKALSPELQLKLGGILEDTRKAVFVYGAFTSIIFLLMFIGIMTLRLFGVWRSETFEKATNVVEVEAYRAEAGRPIRDFAVAS